MRDLIERQAVLNAIAANCIRENEYNLTSSRIKNAVEQLPSVNVAEKTDDYKQGWHDAIEKALKEAYTIHHYGDIFRVVQEETLIGVGMAYEQVNAEKTGHWRDKDDKSAVCSCCNRNNTLYGDFCKWCGAKMEVEE